MNVPRAFARALLLHGLCCSPQTQAHSQTLKDISLLSVTHLTQGDARGRA